jgi:hypothetical protein
VTTLDDLYKWDQALYTENSFVKQRCALHYTGKLNDSSPHHGFGWRGQCQVFRLWGTAWDGSPNNLLRFPPRSSSPRSKRRIFPSDRCAVKLYLERRRYGLCYSRALPYDRLSSDSGMADNSGRQALLGVSRAPSASREARSRAAESDRVASGGRRASPLPPQWRTVASRQCLAGRPIGRSPGMTKGLMTFWHSDLPRPRAVTWGYVGRDYSLAAAPARRFSIRPTLQTATGPQCAHAGFFRLSPQSPPVTAHNR